MIEKLNGTHEKVIYKDQACIRLHLNDVSENFPLHWHEAIEVIMPIENIYTITVGNQTQIVKPKEIIIIPPGELHKINAPNYGSRAIMLIDSSLKYNFPEFNIILQIMRPFSYISSEFDPEVKEKLCSILEKIIQEYFSHLIFREATCYSFLLEFFIQLGNTFWTFKYDDDASNKKKSIYVNKILMACTYINERCTDSITIDEVAEAVGFSKFHFCRLFKEHMNMSCYRYLITRKIMHAEKLLTNENFSVTQAAIQSGFNSLSTFNRVFREQKNCTPTEYISLNQKPPSIL